MSLWEFVYYKKEIVGKVVRDGKVFFKHRKTRRFPSRWLKAAVETPPPDVVVEDQSGP